MGWFDEQIREKKKADQAMFEESFRNIAGAVTGWHMNEALYNDANITADAIGEILKYYHVTAKEVPDSLTDINEVLEYLLRPSGFMRRSIKLDKGWYKDAIGAMLGVRKDDGSVAALLPYGIRGYRFYDRKEGRYVRINDKNADLFEKDAICFYKPFPMKKMSITDLIRYLIMQISLSDLIILGVAMLAVTLVGMLLPKLNQQLFSYVIDSGSVRVLIAMAVYMICVSISSLLFGAIRSFASSRISTKLDISVESASMMRVFSLPVDFFKDYSSGELAERLGFINELSNQLVNAVLTTGLTGLFSLVYVAQIFTYAPDLVVPALLVIILTLAISIATILIQVRVSKQMMLIGTKESGISYAMISGIQKIRMAGAEKRAFARWGNIYAKCARLSYNPPLFLKVSGVISTAVSLAGTIAIYFAAVESNVTVANYFAFNTAYGMVSGAFMSLSSIAMTIARIKPTLDMVKPVLQAVPEIDENKTMVTRLSGGIELNNVSFRYKEDMPLVLDDLSLKITPGQYIAIVGKTGCGKSTLMRIMLGFETPQKGAVYYDGRDLKSLDPRSVRQNIGSVMQNGKLFMGDIYSNIVVTAPWLTLDEAWKAAEIAGLADDIRQMPMGMSTMISEGSGGISGGQKQRLLIARAVAPKPRILLFDEATSALDNITQRQVCEALDKMKCTRIVIAHRLSTIRQCDRIIMLDHGKIIEDGTYDELIALDGEFARLVERQRLDVT